MKTFLPNLFTDPTHVRDPFATLRRHIDDLATSFGHAWPVATHIGADAPALNIAESDKAIEIAAELPGVDEKDIKVEIEGQKSRHLGREEARKRGKREELACDRTELRFFPTRGDAAFRAQTGISVRSFRKRRAAYRSRKAGDRAIRSQDHRNQEWRWGSKESAAG